MMHGHRKEEQHGHGKKIKTQASVHHVVKILRNASKQSATAMLEAEVEVHLGKTELASMSLAKQALHFEVGGKR